jgi:hypothetical protein
LALSASAFFAAAGLSAAAFPPSADAVGLGSTVSVNGGWSAPVVTVGGGGAGAPAGAAAAGPACGAPAGPWGVREGGRLRPRGGGGRRLVEAAAVGDQAEQLAELVERLAVAAAGRERRQHRRRRRLAGRDEAVGLVVRDRGDGAEANQAVEVDPGARVGLDDVPPGPDPDRLVGDAEEHGGTPGW